MGAPDVPDWFVPMAATLTQERFTGPEWIFERKFDGIRLLAYKKGQDVCLFSRNRLPQHCPAIAGAVAALPAYDLVLDGEMSWSGPVRYDVFDLVWQDADLRRIPLEERRRRLAALPLHPPLHHVRLIEDAEPWAHACREGWEGVIAKRRDSSYEHRRSPHWLKMKCELAGEFLIGGFTDPQGSRVGLGALLVGHFEGSDFVFAGKVGTGLDTRMLLALRARLERLEVGAPPFSRVKGLPRVRAHWVRPEVSVRVGFIEWTVHRKLRHPRILDIGA